MRRTLKYLVYFWSGAVAFLVVLVSFIRVEASYGGNHYGWVKTDPEMMRQCPNLPSQVPAIRGDPAILSVYLHPLSSKHGVKLMDSGTPYEPQSFGSGWVLWKGLTLD